MASKTVKCNNCNLVVSELLAFIQNKLQIMNEEDLVRLCSTCFSSKDIEDGKCLLFDSIPKGKSKITRKGDGKQKRDLFDVIAAFKVTDPELVPIFVAKDLQKLPPLTFDHIDVTKLLKDIVVLQDELSKIKSTYVTETQLNELRNDLINLQQSSVINNYDFEHINRKRGGGLMDSPFLNSGPFGLPHIAQESSDVQNNNSSTNLSLPPSEQLSPTTECAVPTRVSVTQQQAQNKTGSEDSLVASNNTSLLVRPVSRSNYRAEQTCDSVWSKLHTARDENTLYGRGEDQIVENPLNNWTKVTYKKKKYKFLGIKGKAECIGNFRAAETKIPLFINYVAKQTTEEDIIQYIAQKTQCKVTLKKINVKHDRGYNSYKVFVPQPKITMFLKEDLWPEGVTFRRFVYIKRYEESKLNRIDKRPING